MVLFNYRGDFFFFTGTKMSRVNLNGHQTYLLSVEASLHSLSVGTRQVGSGGMGVGEG